ncbi:PorT family protein [Flavobacterium sp. NG2]|uniref:PorT family protein n=1 Tax=Flavobacterium sp. NG2 TaxID=3097547 RepID=UPI002A80F894|nr:PorT family protein [Flavobacterium sp. NG2]WPR72243.1 PorT family protein [Flavobacterium sp. NG2]
MKNRLLIAFLFLSTIYTHAQYGYRDSNRIGITIGVNQMTLNTDNFQTKAETGWNGGLSMRGNFYNSWDMIYAMQFSENNFSVATKYNGIIDEDVKYKLPSAQISLQLSYVILENHLSFEFGPIVQLNGKLKLDADKENNTINGTTLRAIDIIDVSKFNLFPTVGITAGGKHLRFNVSYQYGVTNLLGNLNSNNQGNNLRGNASIINGNMIIYL